MWNYYTKNDNNQGFSLGFSNNSLCDGIENLLKEQNKDQDKFPYLFRGKVIYEEKEQIELIKIFFEKFYKAIEKDGNINPKNTFENRCDAIFHRLELLGTFFKAPCFKCEEEYRLAFDFYDENGSNLSIPGKEKKYRSSNGMKVPYYVFNFNEESLNTVTLSPSLNKEAVVKNYKMFLSDKGFRDVIVRNSEIPVRF